MAHDKADDLTAERAAELCFKLALLVDTGTHLEVDTEAMAAIAQSLKTARQEALREAARQTCMYCSGNARGYTLGVAGPNSAGNYTHEVPEDSWAKEGVLCKATSIWSLIYFEDRLASEEA